MCPTDERRLRLTCTDSGQQCRRVSRTITAQSLCGNRWAQNIGDPCLCDCINQERPVTVDQGWLVTILMICTGRYWWKFQDGTLK